MPATVIIRPDGKVLTLDGVLRLSFSPTIMVTDHPIEDGTSVADHAQAAPDEFTITGLVTETPYRLPTQPAETDRVGAAVDFLRGCVGLLLTVVDERRGTFTNCLLTKYPHEIGGRLSTTFELGFKVVKIANAIAIDVPPAFTAAPQLQDAGQQPTVPVEPPPIEDASTMYHFLHGVFGFDS